MIDTTTHSRVIYVGTARQRRVDGWRWLGLFEPERVWRQRLAQEMEDACQEMARRGLRLNQVVPVVSAESLKGTWTEGAWLYFGCAEHAPAADSAF
jgi:hypothetical protein